MNKPSKKTCECLCHKLPFHNCMICDCRKPSKKTEWEVDWEKFIDMNLKKISLDLKVKLMFMGITFIDQLLHQRDNEIREKIYDFYMKQHGEKLKSWNVVYNDIISLLDI